MCIFLLQRCKISFTGFWSILLIVLAENVYNLCFLGHTQWSAYSEYGVRNSLITHIIFFYYFGACRFLIRIFTSTCMISSIFTDIHSQLYRNWQNWMLPDPDLTSLLINRYFQQHKKNHGLFEIIIKMSNSGCFFHLTSSTWFLQSIYWFVIRKI